VLLPKLLLKNRISYYFITTILLILIINYLFIYVDPIHDFLFNVFNGSRSGNPGNQWDNLNALPGKPGRPGRGAGMHPGRGGYHRRWHNPDYLVYAYNVIIAVLIVGFNATLKYTTRGLKDEQDRKEIEKEKLKSQLKSLQQQVSPHFFMNTLNNIHALIDYNGKDAQEAVLRLSNMMRYLLYDSEKGKTTLKKEVEFLRSYIDLMKLRITETVELKIAFPEKIPDIEIYPYLFISFLENAFKHGIDHENKGYIHVSLTIPDNRIRFNIKNSKPDSVPPIEDYSGIGIENAKKRLNLLYGNNYKLDIIERINEFEVDLIIPYED
jgi:uncharacterized membrane-anchored protein YhcB (DUF1043 family)